MNVKEIKKEYALTDSVMMECERCNNIVGYYNMRKLDEGSTLVCERCFEEVAHKIEKI